VASEEAESLILDGWEHVANLPNGKVIVKRKKSVSSGKQNTFESELSKS
jgi:hypothetical protein